MSHNNHHRKRKPAIKPLSAAVDELYWRAKIVSEFLEGYTDTLSIHANDAVRRMVEAIADYEASRDYSKMPAIMSQEREEKL